MAGAVSAQAGHGFTTMLPGQCASASAWGFTDAISEAWDRIRRDKPAGHSGFGTTLSANVLAMAAMRATLAEVMTESAYAHMNSQAGRLAAGLDAVISRNKLPWHVVRVGARVEFICAPGPLRNGSDAAQALAPELDHAVHLGLLNRGCVVTPFHNMMLLSPATTPARVDRLVAAFDDVARALAA